MTESPDTAWSTHRKLYLKWCDLIETDGFTGAHLNWHQAERNIRLRQMKQSWDDVSFSPSYPNAVDHIGIAQTVALAKKRFEQRRVEVLRAWAALPDPRSEQYHASLTELRESVNLEVAGLWKGEWHADWFDRACRKKVDEALVELQRIEIHRLRQIEIKHMENPYLSLAELVAAGGNISWASQSKSITETIQRGYAVLEGLKQAPSSHAHGESTGKRNRIAVAFGDLSLIDPAPLGEPSTSSTEGSKTADGGIMPPALAFVETSNDARNQLHSDAPAKETSAVLVPVAFVRKRGRLSGQPRIFKCRSPRIASALEPSN
jgi:hypothetical protein